MHDRAARRVREDGRETMCEAERRVERGRI